MFLRDTRGVSRVWGRMQREGAQDEGCTGGGSPEGRAAARALGQESIKEIRVLPLISTVQQTFTE